MNIYDVMIIGAGAAGLYAAASAEKQVCGLIVNGSQAPGMKLLATGGGHCNFTNAADIRQFPVHYGETGAKLRSLLYKHNNLAVRRQMEAIGIESTEQQDGRVFPASMNARHLRDALVQAAEANGFQIKNDSTCVGLQNIVIDNQNVFQVLCRTRDISGCSDSVTDSTATFYACRVIVASGGCSYPGTGSDGSMFSVLEAFGIPHTPLRPALAPILPQDYPYKALAGISVPAKVSVLPAHTFEAPHAVTGEMLFTHEGFSGPAVLNLSRYALPGRKLAFCWLPQVESEPFRRRLTTACAGQNTQIVHLLTRITCLPKKLVSAVISGAETDPEMKSAALSGAACKRICDKLFCDTFSVKATGGFSSAMITAGGVPLSEVDLKTMESKKYPGLYLVGELLDVDGDTGGYNLQFAFSSAHAAMRAIDKE